MKRQMSKGKFKKTLTRRLTMDQILGHFFKRIYHNFHLEDMDFERYLNDYLADPRNVPEPEKINSVRTNIIRQLQDVDQMTWKTFCRGLKILKVEHATLRLDTIRKGGTEYITHPLHLVLTEVLPKPGIIANATGKETHDDPSVPTPLPVSSEEGSTDSSGGTDRTEQ